MNTHVQENNRWRGFNWRENQLYVQEDNTGVSIVPDATYADLWRVRWPDGVLSDDFYNKTMAKENARTIAAQL